MIKNYLLVGIRNLIKNKVYTTINVLGLSIGIATAILIYHMVIYENSFNTNFSNYDRIVRVVSTQISQEEGQIYNVCVPLPAMDAIENTVSHFESMTRIREFGATLTIKDQGDTGLMKKFATHSDETAFFAEPSFFDVFNFDWLSGDYNTALDDPGNIVLTKSWAIKCFNNWESAMGRTIFIDNIVPVVVKGVIEDVPSNCDFPLPFIVSYQTVKNNAELFFLGSNSWGSCSSHNQVFGLLHSSEDINDAEALLASVGKKEYANESGVQVLTHHLQPISEIHYDNRYGHSGTHVISKGRLSVLFIIGMLVLAIACFNFINLSTAQSITRAREVGVRKTLGSSNMQLVVQFMGETGLVVLGSTIIGAVVALFGAPLLRFISYLPENLSIFYNPIIWIILGMGVLGVTLLAGLYPALIMSNYKPTQALNGLLKRGTRSTNTIRGLLVVVQFGVALALIIATIIILMQMKYIGSKDLGFDKDQMYTFSFNNDESTINRQEVLRLKIKQISGVESISFSSDQPLSDNTWSTNFGYDSRPDDEEYEISLKFCDANYQETYGLELMAGQWFRPSDTMRQVVLNMTVLKKLGIENAEGAIGHKIRLGGGRRSMSIVGVVSDFHTHSLHRANQPLLLTTNKKYYWQAGVKLQASLMSTAMVDIKKVYDEILPEQVFNGAFLDDQLDRFYKDDVRLATTCKAFGLLAILLSCLGLFGLATHTVNQRIKEIGVRKVLGASVISIVTLLSRDFIKLVLIALVIASPIAWYMMEYWLEDFAYRINIKWWIFIVSGFSGVGMAFLTIGFQSIKAALANPVQSLRNE